MQQARFVRLAEQSEVDAEHLHAPVLIKGPGGTRLGYGPGRQEGVPEAAAAAAVLVRPRGPHADSARGGGSAGRVSADGAAGSAVGHEQLHYGGTRPVGGRRRVCLCGFCRVSG
jgi:hypothetical protein